MIPIYELHLPEYKLDQKPDYGSIGKKIDEEFIRNFHGKWIAVRGISIQDHPGKSLDEMISVIEELGTDKYDPSRKGVVHELDTTFHIDMHATPIIAKEKVYSIHYTEDRCNFGSVSAEILRDFYEGAIIDRGYSVRLDLFMVYDIDKLKAAPVKWMGDEPKHVSDFIPTHDTCCYQFAEPSNKRAALLGIVKLL